jgi:mannose/cellobiose epimerase-like protein (N-acyl-D-glucosamine 2-epimerase family)
MYPLVGIAAINEATQGTRLSPSSEQEPAAADRQWLTKGIQVIDQNLYDSREGYEGYFADADYDWAEPTGKGFTPTVDGITTNAAAASLLLQQPYYTQRFLRLADEAVAHVVQSMDDPRVKVGFAEGYDGNWNINPADTYNDIGHVLKTAWCLGRAYLVAPKPEYKQAARRLISEVLAHGYDHVNGGPYRTYNWAEGGIWHDAYYDGHGKNQWMMEQAINAGLINYYIADQPADKDQYLKMADQTMDFYVKYMVDWAYGGVW